MVIMSRSQDKLQIVADEISELIGSSFACPPPPPLTLHSSSLIPHPHTMYPSCPPTEEKYGREVRIIPVDFSDGSEIYPQIAENLQDLDIGVLGEGLCGMDLIYYLSTPPHPPFQNSSQHSKIVVHDDCVSSCCSEQCRVQSGVS